MNNKPQYHLKSKIIYNSVKLCIVSFFLLFVNDSLGQSITWQKTYGSIHFNEGFSIVQTPDGGYLAVGRDATAQEGNAWLLRLDQYGDTLWTKFVMNDLPIKIIKSSDGNYLILGSFATIVKININGTVLWQSGRYDSDKRFLSVKQTIDGGYIICGRKEIGFRTYPYLFKINTNGDSLWEQTYTNGIFEGRFNDITITEDNNYIMTGNISDSSYITDKLSLMKTNTFGNILWLRRFDTLKYYYPRTITGTSDGTIILGGINGNINKPLVAKFDSSGTLIWYRIYNQSNLRFGDLKSVILTNDNKYAFTGVWDTIGNFTYHVLLLKTDTSGNEIWHKSFGFNDADGGNEVKQTTDSGYVIIGLRGNYQNGDIYIIKTDPSGNSSVIGIEPVSNIIPVTFSFLPAYPNPFNPQTKLRFEIPQESRVKLIIYDILGREIVKLVDEDLRSGGYSITLNAGNLPSGIYLAKLTAFSKNTEYSRTQKLVLLK